jgi:UPF0755 protein
MKRRAAAVLGGAVLALGLAGALGWHLLSVLNTRPGPLPVARAVIVPRGTPAQLAEALLAAGVIDNPAAFRLATLASKGDGPLHAAELAFPAHASLRAVLAVLRTGRPVQHRLTIPEGLTAAQVALLLDRAPALAGDTPVPEEGAVLPETYAFERGTTRAALAERAAAAMARVLAQEWEQRDAGLPLAGPADMLTLASIVERETSRPEERPLVAAVFLNRLKLGMRLQADPTVAYGVSGGTGVLERPLTRADLDWPTPYNTYRVAGLPPGPISSPGVASLRAVAHPAPSDDLYFVADGGGGHAFARSLEEHNRNVARWRQGQGAPPPGGSRADPWPSVKAPQTALY